MRRRARLLAGALVLLCALDLAGQAEAPYRPYEASAEEPMPISAPTA